MASLVQRDSALLLHGHHLGLLLQAAHDAIHSSQEMVLGHYGSRIAGCYQGSLITYIGYVGTAEARCLAGQEVDIE